MVITEVANNPKALVMIDELCLVETNDAYYTTQFPYTLSQAFKDRFSVTIASFTMLYEQLGRKRFHDLLMEYARTYEYLFLFKVNYNFVFDFGIFERMKQANPNLVIAIFDGEPEMFPVYMAKLAEGADLIFAGDQVAAAHRSLGRNGLPLWGYVSKNDYYPMQVERDIPVSFVGQRHSDRSELVEYLAGHGIQVVWPQFVAQPELVEFFNRTKINLIFTKIKRRPHAIFGASPPSGPRFTIIAILLCKSFPLIEYAPGIESFFEIGREIMCFHSREDLVRKVRYYLEHESEREAMVERGYHRAVTAYEAEAGIADLMRRLALARDVKNYGIKMNEPYITLDFFVDWRFREGVKRIRRGQWRLALDEFASIRYAPPYYRQIARYIYGHIVRPRLPRYLFARSENPCSVAS